MKQKLCLLSALILVISVLFSVPVFATEDGGTTTETMPGMTAETETENTTDTTVNTETFVFELNEDGTGYVLVGVNSSSTYIEIPDFYNDLPVVEIDTNAIGSMGYDNIVIPETIKRMTGNGFEMNIKARTVSVDNLFAWCNIDFETQYSNPLYTKKINSLISNNGCSTLSVQNQVERNLTIPDGIQKINDYAFINCGNIESVTLPHSVTEIGKQAFVDCEKFRRVFYYGCEDELMVNETAFSNIDNIAFHYNMDSHSITYTYPQEGFTNGNFKEPTCTSEGKALAECSCGYVWFETVEQLYHKFENERCIRCDISVWGYSIDDSQGTAAVTGYYDNEDTVLVIPSEIDGYTITEIKTFVMSPPSESVVETLVIPDTVEGITGSFNFVGFKNLKRLVIPISVTEIPDNMLSYSGAESVTIYGVSGSEAEKYAEQQKLDFVDMSTIYSIDTEATEVIGGMLVVEKIEETEIQNLLKPADDYTVSVAPKMDGVFSTGTKVQIKDKDGVTLKEHTLVVKGDTNGDGVCDVLDCMLVELARTGNLTLTRSAFLAGDIANDGEITIEDLDAVVNKIIN